MAQKKNFKNPTMQFISTAEEPQEEPQTIKLDIKSEEQQPQTINVKTVEPQTQPGSFTVPKGYRLEKDYKSERLQLLVRPATKEGLRTLSAELGISMNDLANTIFEEYFERKGRL